MNEAEIIQQIASAVNDLVTALENITEELVAIDSRWMPNLEKFQDESERLAKELRREAYALEHLT